MIFKFAWKTLLFYTIYSSVIFVLYQFLHVEQLAIPFQPVSLIGTAVAFYIGFKNNSSYERLWEGRRIWGNIVNNSRSWGAMVLHYIKDGEADKKIAQKELIYRHLAYINTLRIELRKKPVKPKKGKTVDAAVSQASGFSKESLHQALDGFMEKPEIDKLIAYHNPATQLMRKQSETLMELHEKGNLEHFRHLELMKLVADFYNQQGACERIKSFPLPRQYTLFSNLFVWIFIFVLPFGLLGEFSKMDSSLTWIMIPSHILISWIFMTMEGVGDASENPFENAVNDVPMTAICRNVEIDLKQMMGETEIPLPIAPVRDILL